MPEPVAATDLYEMINLRLTIGGTMDLKTKREAALMAETKRKPTEQTELEKNASHCSLFAFQDPNVKLRGGRDSDRPA